jgi:putative radical SAM enzyme (TIGR03279 family)
VTLDKHPQAPADLRLGGSSGGLIDGVRPGTLADRAGIVAGEKLLSVNGREVRDVVDYEFEVAEERIELLLERGAVQRLVEIDKHPDEDPGLEFDQATFDGTRICTNTCFFCFLKGLPKGLRRTMYVKDDDYRLSFLHGNFVTLTNLSEADWHRLEEQRLSPLNVSVHATETNLRRRMLGNQYAPDIVEQLRRLGSIGISAQTQVVLCPGVNDGLNLERTVSDLASLYPTVQAVSIVPVGASIQYAERMQATGKDGVDALTPDYARRLIHQVRDRQRHFRSALGATFSYLSDEYYLTAGSHLPQTRYYDGFPQYENGIGMARSLLDDWRRLRRRMAGKSPTLAARHLTVACGEMIAPLLAKTAQDFSALTGLIVDVVPVPNTFFGNSIRVSGLLGAGDFIGALRGRQLGDAIFLPRSALDYFGRHFIDDGTPADVERVLARPIAFASAWSEVLKQLEPGAGLEPRPNRVSNGRFWAEMDPRPMATN